MIFREAYVCGALLLLTTLACQRTETETQETMERGQEVTGVTPEPTAGAVWNHLEQEGFKENWELWPGKEEFYEGQEPHGALLITYVNTDAHDAVTNEAGAMPPGAIIVKENYKPDKTLAATTVMYKVEGYDAEHNDWFWLKRLADGTVEASGKVASCQNCHASGAANDYVLTGSL